MSAMDYYKVFYYAASTGSITKAAQQLFITQPSASYAIKQLEEQLGVRLLERQPRGVALTGEGEALFAYVQQSYRLLQAGEQAVAQLRTLQAGIVRMGASDSLCKAFLLPYLERFREAHPGIRIVLTHGKSEDISARLSAGTIDCGIVHLPVPEPLLHILAVRPIQDVFVAAPGLAAGTDPHALADLVQHPFVMLSERSRSRAFFHAYLQTYGLTATPEIEVGSIELLLEFVRRGMGLAFMTRDFAADDLAAGTLVELPVAEPIPGRAIGIITRPGDSLSLAADRFVRGLAESFGG
ncbi:LysR family transcriptional regulator [Paenibacillus sp. HJGM_3]|uniref:LysR family transcriptional regulator n=1 Tax=Paenibacillus sp. HJGM_3 TaxID=3379816 RepID=UPI003857FF8B